MAIKFFRTVIIVLLIIILSIGIIGLFMLVIGIRAYQERYIECEPKELFQIVEWIYDVNFPVDIEDVKAAKTSSRDGTIRFLVKFCADPNTVGILLKSIEERSRIRPYERGHTFITDGWPSPGWARVPIKKGIRYTLRSANEKQTASTDVDFYVDTMDKESVVVYLDGTYLIRRD